MSFLEELIRKAIHPSSTSLDVSVETFLTAFQPKLKYSDVSSAEVAALNSIIKAFSTVWTWWRKYPILQDKIQPDSFRVINASMLQFFSHSELTSPSSTSSDIANMEGTGTGSTVELGCAISDDVGVVQSPDVNNLQSTALSPVPIVCINKEATESSNTTNKEIDALLSSESGSTDLCMEYVCSICDEKIDILNCDLEFSFDMHGQTPKHQEVMKNFNDLFTNSTSIVDSVTKEKCVTIVKSEISSSDGREKWKNNVNATCVIRENKSWYCILCDVLLDSSSDFKSHLVDDDHEKRVTAQVSCCNHNTQFAAGIIFWNGAQYCFYCGTFLKKQTFTSHVSGKDHNQTKESQENCNQPLINWFFTLKNDGQDGIICGNWSQCFSYCIICGKKLRSKNEVSPHIKSINHKSEFKKFVTKLFNDKFYLKGKHLNIVAPNLRDFQVINEILYCLKCGVWINNQERLDSHINSRSHLT